MSTYQGLIYISNLGLMSPKVIKKVMTNPMTTFLLRKVNVLWSCECSVEDIFPY